MGEFREIAHNPSQQNSVELKSSNSEYVDGCRAVSSKRLISFAIPASICVCSRGRYQQTTLTPREHWQVMITWHCHCISFSDAQSVFCAHTLWIEYQTLSSADVVTAHYSDWWLCEITLLLHQHEILAIAGLSAHDWWPVPHTSTDVKVTGDNHLSTHAVTYISGVRTTHVHGSGGLVEASAITADENCCTGSRSSPEKFISVPGNKFPRE